MLDARLGLLSTYLESHFGEHGCGLFLVVLHDASNEQIAQNEHTVVDNAFNRMASEHVSGFKVSQASALIGSSPRCNYITPRCSCKSSCLFLSLPLTARMEQSLASHAGPSNSCTVSKHLIWFQIISQVLVCVDLTVRYVLRWKTRTQFSKSKDNLMLQFGWEDAIAVLALVNFRYSVSI